MLFSRPPWHPRQFEEAVMIHLKNILVPVDFSGPSKKAINYGLSLAVGFKAKLVLAHIAPFDAAVYDRAKLQLLSLLPVEYREQIDFEIIVKAGEVRQELLGIVEDKEIDLVVMGTRGRSYFERMLLGSVTERMLRKLHVPVLTVSHLDPEKEIHAPGPVPLRRIVYATDLMDSAEEGLKFSFRLAHELDAHLTVVHAVQILDAAILGVDTVYLPDYSADARAQAAERLDRTVALASDGSVPTTTVLADGVPYEAINRVAGETNADLIVINLHGKGPFERALLGTTAERVIRTATIPVLSLPLPATYAARWSAA
jgi:nucleotide-binding universal stress UspA family protein